jgi:hypothetical protein
VTIADHTDGYLTEIIRNVHGVRLEWLGPLGICTDAFNTPPLPDACARAKHVHYTTCTSGTPPGAPFMGLHPPSNDIKWVDRGEGQQSGCCTCTHSNPAVHLILVNAVVLAPREFKKLVKAELEPRVRCGAHDGRSKATVKRPCTFRPANTDQSIKHVPVRCLRDPFRLERHPCSDHVEGVRSADRRDPSKRAGAQSNHHRAGRWRTRLSKNSFVLFIADKLHN